MVQEKGPSLPGKKKIMKNLLDVNTINCITKEVLLWLLWVRISGNEMLLY